MEVNKDYNKITYQISQIMTSFYDSLSSDLIDLDIKNYIGKQYISTQIDENCLVFWPEEELLVPSKIKELYYTDIDGTYFCETKISKKISFFCKLQLINSDIDEMQLIKDVLINSIINNLGMEASDLTISYQTDDNTDTQAYTFVLINFQLILPIYSRINRGIDATFTIDKKELTDAPDVTENVYNPLLISPPIFEL